MIFHSKNLCKFLNYFPTVPTLSSHDAENLILEKCFKLFLLNIDFENFSNKKLVKIHSLGKTPTPTYSKSYKMIY